MDIDANKVIEDLINKIGQLTLENTILEVRIKELIKEQEVVKERKEE